MMYSSTNKTLSKVCLGYLPHSPFDLQFTIDLESSISNKRNATQQAQIFLEHIRKVHEKIDK